MSDIVFAGQTYHDVEKVVYNGQNVFSFYNNGVEIWRSQLPADPVLANNTWEQISTISKSGLASSIWNIGDQITIKILGIDYLVDIIGFDHDTPTNIETYGKEKAGITFQLHNLYATTYKMSNEQSNSNGWTNSLIRKSTFPSLFDQLNNDLKTIIIPVNKYTSIGNFSTTIVSSSDNLFLLSAEEVFGGPSNEFAEGEGSQYEYYSSGGSKIKTMNEGNYWSFTRSPNINSDTAYCTIGLDGTLDGSLATSSLGIAFAFCV